MSARHAALPLGAGVTAALATLMLGMTGKAAFALLLPVAFLIGALLVLHPFWGLLFLIFFARLDGVAQLLFGSLPVSSFKFVSAATATGILLSAWSRREMVSDALALPLTRLAIGFCVCVLISTIFAADRAVAISYGTRLVSVIVMSFLIILLVQDSRRLGLTLHALVASGIAASLALVAETRLGLPSLATSNTALTAATAEGMSRSSGGSQYDPTTAAIMLASVLALTIGLAIEFRRLRRLLVVAAVIGCLALILSFSRSAVIAFSVAALFMAVHYRRSRFMLPALVFVLLTGIALLPLVPASYFERFGALLSGEGDWTLGRRLTYQIIGIDVLLKNPFTGIGPGNYPEAFTDPAYRFLPGRTLMGRLLHNMYLSIAAEMGIFAFGTFMAMIVVAFANVRSVMRHPATRDLGRFATALFFAMVTYYFASIFNPNDWNKYTWIYLGLAGAITLINQRQRHAAAAAGDRPSGALEAGERR